MFSNGGSSVLDDSKFEVLVRMEQSSAMNSNKQLGDVAAKEEDSEVVKLEIVVADVKPEPHECVACVTRSSDCSDIYSTRTAASGTSLHAFLTKFTNTELSYSQNFSKYICKSCLDLINVLEQAEIEYVKLKETFEAIISKNPLFEMQVQPIRLDSVKNETISRCNNDLADLNDSEDEPLAVTKKKRHQKVDKRKKKVSNLSKRKVNNKQDESWQCNDCGAYGATGGAVAEAAHQLAAHNPVLRDIKKEDSNDEAASSSQINTDEVPLYHSGSDGKYDSSQMNTDEIPLYHSGSDSKCGSSQMNTDEVPLYYSGSDSKCGSSQMNTDEVPLYYSGSYSKCGSSQMNTDEVPLYYSGSDSKCGSSQMNTDEAPFYNSGSDSKCSDREQESELPPKKKRQSFSWTYVKTFDNMALAHKALSDENTWSVHYSRESGEGKKAFYRCNKVKKRASQCSAKRYLLYDSNSDAVYLYRTDADHDHEGKDSANYRLPEAVKIEIDKMAALHMKPKAILSTLAKIDGLLIPTAAQLRSYLSNQCRRTLYGNNMIRLWELEQWLQYNSVLPEDQHEVFVIGYNISENDAPFNFILSTKYLLGLTDGIDILHIDVTCKLTWQGCSVLVVGTTDKQHKFHALCLAVSATEQKDDFQLIFKSLKNKIQFLYSRRFKPTILVTSAVKSIQNAFTEEFEDSIVRVCWAHARRNIQSRIESDVVESVQNQILDDIDTLHSITNWDAFNSGSQLFLQKYKKQSKFIRYFKEQWLDQNQNWYLGAALASPSTNEAIEAFNKSLRNRNRLRERLALSRFLEIVTEIVNEWSAKHMEEDNFVAKHRVITLKEWMDSYNWSKLPIETAIIPRDDEHFVYYHVPEGNAEECKIYENIPRNFEEFKEQFFSKWEVAMPVNKEEWAQGTCTCPTFFETYMCHHVIGMALRLKHTVPPTVAEYVPDQPKPRKRNRPNEKGHHALIVP